MEETVQAAPDQQDSLTDPDARSMAASGKGPATVGYNVQIAVDAEHHLIVAHEVTNQGYDRHQLAPMALKAQQATGCEQITALADRGYFSGDQVLQARLARSRYDADAGAVGDAVVELTKRRSRCACDRTSEARARATG